MIADGLFERFPMERIFGYHNWPGLDAGTVAVHDAAVMASGGRIEFRVKGHSGHAALPHLDARPDGGLGASAAGAADDRFAQRRSAGRRGDHVSRRWRRAPRPIKSPARPSCAARCAPCATQTVRCGGGSDPSRRRRRGAELRCGDRCGAAPRQSGDGEHPGRAGPRGGRRGRGGPAAAARHAAGDDRRGFRLVSASSGPAPSSGSATARPMAGASCTTRTTITTTRSCRRRLTYLAGVAKRALGQ